MRCVQWAVVVLVAGVAAPHARAVEFAYGGCAMGAFGGRASLCAPACGCPSYGALEPGCCECQPNCCTHVWDGYCQEQAQRCCCCDGWFAFPWPCCLSSKTERVVVTDCEACGEASVEGGAVQIRPTAPMPVVKTLPKPPKPAGVSWVVP